MTQVANMLLPLCMWKVRDAITARTCCSAHLLQRAHRPATACLSHLDCDAAFMLAQAVDLQVLARGIELT